MIRTSVLENSIDEKKSLSPKAIKPNEKAMRFEANEFIEKVSKQ